MLYKKGDQFWQMVLILLAVVSLVVVIIIIVQTQGEISLFSDWLQWVN